MTKKEFNQKCKCTGAYNSIAIEDALIQLLSSQNGQAISIPATNYCSSNPNMMSKEEVEDGLVEYLQGTESVGVMFVDDNDHECYISEVKLENKRVKVKVYDYYGGKFNTVELNRFVDSRDVMHFALEYAKFDKALTKDSPADLDDKQLILLDNFVNAARKLNEAGVSLFWNDEDNALAVINRDKLRDCDFYSFDDMAVASDPESQSLFKNLGNNLDIEITFISKDVDYLYYPESDE